jgi:hypothetical protein
MEGGEGKATMASITDSSDMGSAEAAQAAPAKREEKGSIGEESLETAVGIIWSEFGQKSHLHSGA